MTQKGFTLLELVLAVSIVGMIAVGTSVSIAQIMRGGPQLTEQNSALADIDSAAHWITRDLILAQDTSLADGAPPVSGIAVNWSDLTAWAGSEGAITHSVTYVLSGTTLRRTYDGVESTVGRYLTDIEFSLNGKMFTVTLTSRPGWTETAVTRTFSIQMRSDLGP